MLDGVSIGDDVVIGANAVVNEDLPAGVVAAGIPARVLRQRDPGATRRMSRPQRVLVVTSGALFVRGGHMVIAEETVAALRREGFTAEVLVTPQNRFGRQLSAYAATWLTDVGETADGKPVDQVISFRFPSYAVRHPRHVCWLNHRMREYYDLWERFTRGLGRKGRLKEGVRRQVFHALDRRLLTRNAAFDSWPSRRRSRRACNGSAASARAFSIRRRRSGRTAPTATATTCSRCRACTR